MENTERELETTEDIAQEETPLPPKRVVPGTKDPRVRKPDDRRIKTPQ